MPKTDPAQIDLLVLDVDGVLTDGRIIYDDQGRELKCFCVKDGAGIKYWHRAGKASAILSGRHSAVVTVRAAELGIPVVRQKALDKLPILQEILDETGIPAERTAYVGDDLPDIPPMRACGLGIAVADAVEEVRAMADHVLTRPGGHAAVREAIEWLLRAGGHWDTILKRYG